MTCHLQLLGQIEALPTSDWWQILRISTNIQIEATKLIEDATEDSVGSTFVFPFAGKSKC